MGTETIDEKEQAEIQRREDRADRLSYLLGFNYPATGRTREQLIAIHSNQDVSVLLEHAHGLGREWESLNKRHALATGELSRLQRLLAFLCAEFDVEARYGKYVIRNWWEEPEQPPTDPCLPGGIGYDGGPGPGPGE